MLPPEILPALHADGQRCTIAGYASLMDCESARLTTPSLINFRYGAVEGYARIFNLVSIVNIQRGLATGQHLATATARPSPAHRLLVCLFDVPVGELPSLLQRERRLRHSCVPFREVGTGSGSGQDEGEPNKCVLFTEYSDDEYFRERCGGDEAVFHDEVGQFYRGRRIYRDDLLPVPSYLVRCVRAHRQVGDRAFLANFLDGSFLGDGKTTVRAYLRAELAGGAPRAHHGAVARAEDDRVPDDAPAKPHWTPSEREELARAVAEEA